MAKEKKRKKKIKIVVATAKRKESVARARIKEGKGVIRINKRLLSAIHDPFIREVIEQPLKIAEEYIKNFDIRVNVRGGGPMGQAQAVRSAIAKGIVEYTGDEELKRTFLKIDRNFLVDDPRRVEPKKYLGRKARARFQKSYR